MQHIRLEVAGRVGVNAKLELGEQTEVVTVTNSGGAQLHTEDSTLGFTVESRSANELPLLYSNPFELQLLRPGVSQYNSKHGSPHVRRRIGEQHGQWLAERAD